MERNGASACALTGMRRYLRVTSDVASCLGLGVAVCLRPGITCNEPGKNLDHAFRETLSMGGGLSACNEASDCAG